MLLFYVEVIDLYPEVIDVQEGILVEVLQVNSVYRNIIEKIHRNFPYLYACFHFSRKPFGRALAHPGLCGIGLNGKIKKHLEEDHHAEQPQKYFSDFFDNFDLNAICTNTQIMGSDRAVVLGIESSCDDT